MGNLGPPPIARKFNVIFSFHHLFCGAGRSGLDANVGLSSAVPPATGETPARPVPTRGRCRGCSYKPAKFIHSRNLSDGKPVSPCSRMKRIPTVFLAHIFVPQFCRKVAQNTEADKQMIPVTPLDKFRRFGRGTPCRKRNLKYVKPERAA